MTQIGWLKRDGLRLAIHGQGTDGRPLVFQHGLCGSAAQVAEAMAGIAPQRWQSLECRGHGASEAGEWLSIATFAEDVAALVETIGAPVVLGGISMGAAIATRIAVTRPDLVSALILVRPAWVAAMAPDTMRPNAEVGRLLEDLPADQARRAFAASNTALRLGRDAPDNLSSLTGFFDRQPLDLTARLLRRISADGPGISPADLRAIRLPVLVCGTAEDAIHPLALARDLAVLIPGARLAELPPKGRDKPAHLSALSVAMAQFLEEI